MITNRLSTWWRREPRGISMVIVAVGMIFVLGMAGLAIDLASLYVGRSQAQRSADAAALAGAQALVDGSCLSGSVGGINADCQALARQRAETMGNQNLIAGESPGIRDSDISFDLSNSNDPRITVVAARDAVHGNSMPTFFVKIFGVDTANVSASATAEAYKPSGSDLPIGVKCVKPWFLPNCDPYNTTTGDPNPDCSPGTRPYILGEGDSATVARPDPYPAGAMGEPLTMKPGDPGSAPAPGQYLAAFIPNDTIAPTLCPDCAKSAPINGGTGSAAIYRENIECCNQNTVVCGLNGVKIASTAGNMVGPTTQGVQCLIHQDPNCGQDYLSGINGPCVPTSDPPQSNEIPTYGGSPPGFTVIPGANNPFFKGESQILLSQSDSVAAVPIYKGVLQSGQNQVYVIGFMKVFIKYVDSSQQGTVYGYILDITRCGGGGSGSGSGTVVSGGAGATVPVRLIRPGS